MEPRPGAGGSRRFVLLHVLPVLAILLVKIAPLLTGRETLYLRDVVHTHLGMKAAQAEGLRRGALPLLDPYRAGGQPLAGNPNPAAFYPDNLLYLVAGPLWAFNAHYWLHLVLAPLAFFWLARSLGLGREGAWAAAVFYALGGYVLSLMAFYNLIAGAALVPALVAACLDFAAGRRRAPTAGAIALLWALLILGGDPLTALLALLVAAAAFAALAADRRRALVPLLVALACGTLLAAPQIVEFLRVLGTSYRGTTGYSPETLTATSLDPRQALEWLVPLAFGRPDRLGPVGFWGQRYFTDRPAYFFSLYPGLLSLALFGASFALRGRVAGFARGLALAGLFLSLGRFNPAARWIIEHAGGLVRYPIRFWLLAAAGLALLSGMAFEAVTKNGDKTARRILRLALAVAVLLFAAAWAILNFMPERGHAVLRAVMPPGTGAGGLEHERARWTALCLASLLVALVLALLVVFGRRWPREAAAGLLLAHAAAQIFFLAPLLSTDAVAHYTRPPPALALVPPSSLVVQGRSEDLFRTGESEPGSYPDGRAVWLARRACFELYPFAGALWRRSYELNVSSEGMDSFLSVAARDAVRLAADAGRLRLLASWGVDRLLLDRELDAEARPQARLLNHLPGPGGTLYVYELPGASPAVFLAARTLRAPDLNSAVRILADPAFDPRSSVVVPGSGPPQEGSGGEVRVLGRGPESLSVEVDAPSPGILVVQRAFQPLYRARVDDRRATLRIANLHRIGIDVPAGRHRVELWVDRRPLRASAVLSLLGACALAALVWRLHAGATRVRVV